MSLLSRARSLLGIPQSALSIQLDDDWRCENEGTRWRFVQETDVAIKLKKELVKQCKHMDTGETAELVRVDAKVEWYSHDVDWPEYAQRAYDDGEVWCDDIDEDIPHFWGQLISNSGSTWKRID
jgi:hypothetical protein